VIRRAALDSRVERIFVAPGIKKKLCETMSGDRTWLSKVRPYYGHNYHFHVRLSCPPGTPCKKQSPPPSGDGCGADLDYWFTAEPYKPTPPGPQKQMMLADLPPACKRVLEAQPIEGTMTMREAFALKVGLDGSVPPIVPFVSQAAAAELPVFEPRLPRPRPAGQ
jgi:penicillin-insensitive murein endopeptidase